jgi:hypothetical protein
VYLDKIVMSVINAYLTTLTGSLSAASGTFWARATITALNDSELAQARAYLDEYGKFGSRDVVTMRAVILLLENKHTQVVDMIRQDISAFPSFPSITKFLLLSEAHAAGGRMDKAMTAAKLSYDLAIERCNSDEHATEDELNHNAREIGIDVYMLLCLATLSLAIRFRAIGRIDIASSHMSKLKALCHKFEIPEDTAADYIDVFNKSDNGDGPGSAEAQQQCGSFTSQRMDLGSMVEQLKRLTDVERHTFERMKSLKFQPVITKDVRVRGKKAVATRATADTRTKAVDSSTVPRSVATTGGRATSAIDTNKDFLRTKKTAFADSDGFSNNSMRILTASTSIGTGSDKMWPPRLPPRGGRMPRASLEMDMAAAVHEIHRAKEERRCTLGYDRRQMKEAMAIRIQALIRGGCSRMRHHIFMAQNKRFRVLRAKLRNIAQKELAFKEIQASCHRQLEFNGVTVS